MPSEPLIHFVQSTCVGLPACRHRHVMKWGCPLAGVGFDVGGFWVEIVENVVVVEADAFKETYVIYQALISEAHHNDMIQTGELVIRSVGEGVGGLMNSNLQDDKVGDGTTSMVVWLGELLREAEKLLTMKIHPMTIIAGLF
ncbi:zeta toxin domain [Tanacetum coccineum]